MKQNLENGRTGPTSLKRSSSRLSEHNHVSLGVFCLLFASSELNVVSQDFARLAFAWLTLERTVSVQFWSATMVARLSDGILT